MEVGTGFHPELTGRENVYINGAILGMTRREVDAKFDEIVEFAGVSDFIDTPIKRYSSGMTVRLGFAVAAHLDPDILIVDEVLAVGDAAFQKKCIGKMQSISDSGRTIIFVSHNMASIESLCSQSIFLDQGKIISTGIPKVIIEEYMSRNLSDSTHKLKDREDRQGSGLLRVEKIEIVDDKLQKINFAKTGTTLSLIITFSYTVKSYPNTRFCLSFTNGKGERIFTICSNLINYCHDFSKNKAILIKFDKLNGV